MKTYVIEGCYLRGGKKVYRIHEALDPTRPRAATIPVPGLTVKIFRTKDDAMRAALEFNPDSCVYTSY